jgi:hypothetical protein
VGGVARPCVKAPAVDSGRLCAAPLCTIPITDLSLTDTFCSHTCSRAWEVSMGIGLDADQPKDGGAAAFPYGTRGPGICQNDGTHNPRFAFSWLDVRLTPDDVA